MQKEDKTTLKKRKSTSSRAALVSMRCPTVDGYWPYLNAKETVILEVATSLCLFFKEKRKWVESCETGRVRDLLCKNILRKVHSAVWHLNLFGFYFFGQVRLGFSLVKSFAEDSVPCFISVCLGWGGGWEEEGLLCVSSLRISVVLYFPFCPLFLELPAGTPWNRLVSF